MTDTSGSEGGDIGDTGDVTRLPWLSCVSGAVAALGGSRTRSLCWVQPFLGWVSSLSHLLEWGTWAWSPQGSSELGLRDKSWGCQRCHQDPHD